MKKVTLMILLGALVNLCFTGEQAFAQEPIMITDQADRMVKPAAVPERIVCLGPGCLRLICYLGSQDKVVGIERFEAAQPVGRPYRYANPQLLKLPKIGPGGPAGINKDPDLEAVLNVRPQVIFATYMTKSVADSLERKLKIPVVVLTYGRFGTFDPAVYDALKIAGKILDRTERAEAVVAFVEKERKELKRRTDGADEARAPSVYVGGIGFKGMQGITSTDPRYVPLEWVNAGNVAKKASETDHVFIDKEKLMAWNPRIIFVDGLGLKLVAEDYNRNAQYYQSLEAFKKEQVYLLYPFNSYVVNLGTTIADAYAVGKICYPDRFSDIDVEKKADEAYTFLLKKPIYHFMKRDFGVLGAVPSFLDVQAD